MNGRAKVWFHRARAIGWAIVGVLSFIFGWQESVMLVWIASLYANISTDWGNGEAADDREVVNRLDQIKNLLSGRHRLMFTFKVTPDGKDPYEVEALHRDILKWERTKGGNAFALRQPTFSALYEIAYIASKRTGQFNGGEEAFEELCEVTVLDAEDEPDPTKSAA